MRTTPACWGFVLCLMGYLLGSQLWLASIVLVLFLCWRRNLWLVMAFVMGVVLQHIHAKEEHFWKNFFQQDGYAKLIFKWDEDVFLSRSEKGVQGWGRVRAGPGGPERRWWLIVNTSEELPIQKMLKGYEWQGKVVVSAGQIPRSLKTTGEGLRKGEMSFPWSLREKIILRLERSWSELPETRGVALVRSMVTGNRRGLTGEVQHTFSRLGIPHLLALSGLHVGIIFGFIFALFKLMPGLRKWGGVVSLSLVLIYGLTGGWSISLERAVYMCALALFAMVMGRKYIMLNALAFLAWIEILRNPEHLESISFQLSYLGVLGIAWMLSILKNTRGYLQKLPGYLHKLVHAYLISWGAMLFTWPVVAHHFNVVPTWSWLFSIPMLLLFTLIVISSFLIAVISLTGLGISTLFWWPVQGYQELASFFSGRFSWVSASGEVDLRWMGIYYAGLVLILLCCKWPGSQPKRT